KTIQPFSVHNKIPHAIFKYCRFIEWYQAFGPDTRPHYLFPFIGIQVQEIALLESHQDPYERPPVGRKVNAAPYCRSDFECIVVVVLCGKRDGSGCGKVYIWGKGILQRWGIIKCPPPGFIEQGTVYKSVLKVKVVGERVIQHIFKPHL